MNRLLQREPSGCAPGPQPGSLRVARRLCAPRPALPGAAERVHRTRPDGRFSARWWGRLRCFQFLQLQINRHFFCVHVAFHPRERVPGWGCGLPWRACGALGWRSRRPVSRMKWPLRLLGSLSSAWISSFFFLCFPFFLLILAS